MCIIKLVMLFLLHFLHIFKHHSFLGSFRKSCLNKHIFLHVHYTSSAVSSCHMCACTCLSLLGVSKSEMLGSLLLPLNSPLPCLLLPLVKSRMRISNSNVTVKCNGQE